MIPGTGDFTLEGLSAMLRGLADGQAASRAIAVEAAPLLVSTLQANVGRDPNTGETWAPTKAGGQAYKNAASKITGTTAGNLVTISVRGGEAYGQYAAGVPLRRTLPDVGGDIPEIVRKALLIASRNAFQKMIGGVK